MNLATGGRRRGTRARGGGAGRGAHLRSSGYECEGEIVGVEREEGERAGVHERRGERVPELARDGHHDDERDAHVPVNERRVGRRIQTRARRTRSRGHHRHHDARRERVLDDARARDAVVAAGDERNEWWGPKIGITFGDCTSS